MNLPPYSENKDSGVDWLGDIPVHWDVYPHRSLFREIIERGYPDEELLSVTISQGVIRQAQLLANSSKKDSSNTNKSSYKLVTKGDIAYNKMRAWQGAIGVSDYQGIISPAYIVIRLREIRNDPRYFHYLFRTPLFTTEAERWSYGITSDQWSLRYGEFKQIYSPLPPPEEQAAIVAFLDAAEKRIRRHIRAKQKLIKLLNEQKQAIIQQAVTRGLNPDVAMKDSSVEWLGEIPEHWEITALRHRYSAQLGKMLDAKRITNDFSLPYLRNRDVQWGEINIVDLPIMDIHPSEYARYTLEEGDLLVCEGGEVGRSAFWHGEVRLCGFQKALHRVRVLNHELDTARFLYYV